jgi:hypothetical protein
MKRFSAYCRGAVRVGATIFLVLSSVQCSLMVDADKEQCTSNADCQNLGKEFAGSVCDKDNAVCVADTDTKTDPAWACLDEAASSNEAGSETVTISIPLVDVITKTPMPGIKGQLHPKIDSDLAKPLGEPVVSNADGIIEFTVKSGFDGFVALSSDEIAPSLYFINPPATANSTVDTVRLASMEMASALVTQVGSSVDPNRGFIILTAKDCQGKAAEGVSYSSLETDDHTQVFYSVDGLVTVKTSATDDSGYGGFVAMRPGSVNITGSHQTYGKIGTLSLFVKPSTVSYARMVPSAQ